MVETNPQARTWGMACHLAVFAGALLPVLGNIIGPLVVWLMKKDEYPFVDDQGKEALNFQISMMIYMAVAGVLVLLLVGFFLLAILGIMDFVLVIIAAVKANQGVRYRYPFTIRFIK